MEGGKAVGRLYASKINTFYAVSCDTCIQGQDASSLVIENLQVDLYW